ncbi:MAG: hypothetical protein V3T05_11975 [Myxococcota bacterium]
MINREQRQVIAYLTAENRGLKEQLKKHGRLRFTDRQRRLLAVKAKELGRAALRKLDTVVCQDTLLRWYQQLVAQKYDGSGKRGPGRARIMQAIEALIVRMARENPGWGYTRIRGALSNLGHDVGRTTIVNVLARHGIEPAPNRKTTWRQFLQLHWDVIGAADFFTVEICSAFGLVRYHVLFVIELCTRRAHIAGIIHNPYGEWVEQVARNLTDGFDGCAPAANEDGEVRCRQRLGGLLRYYHRDAA